MCYRESQDRFIKWEACFCTIPLQSKRFDQIVARRGLLRQGSLKAENRRDNITGIKVCEVYNMIAEIDSASTIIKSHHVLGADAGDASKYLKNIPKSINSSRGNKLFFRSLVTAQKRLKLLPVKIQGT